MPFSPRSKATRMFSGNEVVESTSEDGEEAVVNIFYKIPLSFRIQETSSGMKARAPEFISGSVQLIFGMGDHLMF